LNEKWLKRQPTDSKEIAMFLGTVERDLKQARMEEISADWRLAMVFNAALSCCIAALRASGYRLGSVPGHHEKAIESLRYTLESDRTLIEKLHSYRRKRSRVVYDEVGVALESEVAELIELTQELQSDLQAWLKDKHPDLLKD